MAVEQSKIDAWKSTIDTLQRFYTVVFAIALTSGLSKLVGFLEEPHSSPEIIGVVALAVAFLSTIVPFYHGMERHLYETHRVLPKLGKGGRPFPLLADIFVIMVEGGILFAMARNLDDTFHFLVLWSALLIVDIAWSLIVWRVQKGDSPIWPLNNFVWLAIAWLAWWGIPWLGSTGASNDGPMVAVAIAIIEVGRSVADYILNWQFYFPDSRREAG